MKSKYILFFVGGIVLLGGIAFLASNPSTPTAPATTVADPSVLPGMQTTAGSWEPELTHLRTRLIAIGLPPLSAEGSALHIHQHLDVIIHGKSIPIPADIGIGPGFIADVHTHDGSGIIHVESPTTQTFTLGQFFDIWGVKFTAESIGGYTADGNNALKVYSNGKLYEGDPRQLALQSHQEIVVVYGTAQEQPASLPTFTFPAGY